MFVYKLQKKIISNYKKKPSIYFVHKEFSLGKCIYIFRYLKVKDLICCFKSIRSFRITNNLKYFLKTFLYIEKVTGNCYSSRIVTDIFFWYIKVMNSQITIIFILIYCHIYFITNIK